MANITVSADVHSLLNSAGNLPNSTNALGALGAPVTGASIVSKLSNQNLSVASIQLTDGTGTALAVGSLSLNAAKNVVVHDLESNAEDLAYLVNSRESSNFAKVLTAANMTGATTFVKPIAEMLIKSSEITNGSAFCFSGQIRNNWTTGTKPDSGVYLWICREGTTPTNDGMFFNLAEGNVSELRDFSVPLSFSISAGVWSISFVGGGSKAICIKNNSGTITSVPAWTFATDMDISSSITNTVGQPVKLQVYVVTVNASATVTSTLTVSGNLSVIFI